MISQRFTSESGAALITVLMIVAAISVVAVGLNSAVTAATQRARLLDAQGQLRLYTIAAEAAAQQRLSEIMATYSGRLNADIPGLSEAHIFPVPDGEISVTVNDVTSCFDLNRLITSSVSGGYVANADAVEEYITVLTALDFDQGEATALANAAVDWMDANSVPGSGGAEDSYYSGEVPSYRTSSQPLANVSELAAIRGYTAQVRAQIQGVVCTRPMAALDPTASLNLNTISPMQSGQLVNALSAAIEPAEARRLIETRPLGGWPDIESFTDEPVIAKISPDARKLERLGFVTTHVEVLTKVSYREGMITMVFQFETREAQPVKLLARERVE